MRRPSSLLFLVSLARVASSYLFCPLACPPVVCRRRSGREREGCTRTAAHPSFGRFHSMRGAVLLSMFQRVVRVVASCSLIVFIAVGVAGVVLVLVLLLFLLFVADLLAPPQSPTPRRRSLSGIDAACVCWWFTFVSLGRLFAVASARANPPRTAHARVASSLLYSTSIAAPASFSSVSHRLCAPTPTER